MATLMGLTTKKFEAAHLESSALAPSGSHLILDAAPRILHRENNNAEIPATGKKGVLN